MLSWLLHEFLKKSYEPSLKSITKKMDHIVYICKVLPSAAYVADDSCSVLLLEQQGLV